MSDRTVQILARAPPKQNRRLRVVRTVALSSPDLGCPRSPTMLLELSMERHKNNRGPGAPSSASALAECNCRRVLISTTRGLPTMGSLVVPRRRFLRGLASLGVFAPAVVRASSLMVSARFCRSSRVTPACAATQEALALLQ